MIRLLIPLVLGATAAQAAGSGLCDLADDDLIFTSCAGGAVELRLLPEDAGATPDGALDVTGGYTATDRRDEGRPKPVGLFVRGGEVISREYVRFDGVLTITDGAPALHHRRRILFGGQRYDLEDVADRAAFLSRAADSKSAVMQSHLLIVDGKVDTAPIDGAPRFRRRILFQLTDGPLGVFDSSPRMLTLNEATEEVAARFAPAMALNLDMGSYDFCRSGAKLCGTLGPQSLGKLSNLLRFVVASE
mgnify:CR=1 FL=1